MVERMKNINDMESFEDEQDLFIMPDVRMIEKAYRCGFNWEETPWEKLRWIYRGKKSDQWTPEKR